MGHKPLKKKSKSTWTCPHKCDLSKGICKHLEELLPSMQSGNNTQRLKYHSNPEMLGSEAMQYASLSKKDTLKFIATLKHLGLQEYQVTVLMERFALNKTLAEITKDNGFTSVNVTYYILKQTLKQIEKALESQDKKQ